MDQGPLSEAPSGPRQAHGFERTVCGCAYCQAYCRHVPGALDPSDLAELCPAGQDVFAWAEQHLRARTGQDYPVLVPARNAQGHCHWYFAGRCAVHQHSPFGCAFFDAHMSEAEAARRSEAAVQARRQDATVGGLYHLLWLHLLSKGLLAPRADRDALRAELEKVHRSAAASLRRARGE